MSGDRPPQAFFDALRAATLEAYDELAELGFTKVWIWDCLPSCDWPNGWWDCRGFRVGARDAYGNNRFVEREVVARKFKRRLRRTKKHGGK